MSVNIFESEVRRAFEAFEAAQRTIELVEGFREQALLEAKRRESTLLDAFLENERRDAELRKALCNPFQEMLEHDRMIREAVEGPSHHLDSMFGPADMSVPDVTFEFQNPMEEIVDRVVERLNQQEKKKRKVGFIRDENEE